jgi:hypothetical protein
MKHYEPDEPMDCRPDGGVVIYIVGFVLLMVSLIAIWIFA